MTQLRQRQVGFIHSRDFPPSTGEFESLSLPVPGILQILSNRWARVQLSFNTHHHIAP
jgi:hypothetical protein